jgi:hypothetical protein
MTLYELTYECPDLSKGTVAEQVSKNALYYKKITEYIAADSQELVLSYARKEIKSHQFSLLISLIRGNPIYSIKKTKKGSIMYSYEIVYEHPDLSKGSIKEQAKPKIGSDSDGVSIVSSIALTTTTQFVVAETHDQVLELVHKELERFTDYDLIAIVRRNSITKVIKSEDNNE